MKKSISVKNLEEKYKDRGLSFDEGHFYGSHPTQADGVIDGMVFYFRFRHDRATLRVGKYFTYKGKEVNNFLPHYILYSAAMGEVTGEEYAGQLTYEQQEEVFGYLIDNLMEYEETPKQREFREELEARLIDDIENPKPEWER